jgi:predicted dehydrogenase
MPVSVTSKIRIGIAGAPRGRSFLAGLAAYGDRAEIRAVYEPDPAARQKFAADTGVDTPASYADLLTGVDAVILASPQHHHAPQAIMALDACVHVLSEVPAAVSLEQAQGLLTAVRRSGAHYMIAENYCFSPANLTIKEMARAGLFGDLYFGEGEYLHEMKSWHTDANGRPTWRYHWQVGRAGITYPTHSLGPLLWWFQDRVVAVSCSGTGRHTDPEHEIDDTVLMLARTAHGALLKIRLDLLSNRPHLMNYYSVQGTAGAYEAARVAGAPNHVYLLGQSPASAGEEAQWEPLDAYTEKFLPERYRQVAAGAGHGGTDTWPVRDFLDAVVADRTPELDIYAALDMTLPGLVSEDSFYEHGAWRAVPNPRLWAAGVGAEPGREYPLA